MRLLHDWGLYVCMFRLQKRPPDAGSDSVQRGVLNPLPLLWFWPGMGSHERPYAWGGSYQELSCRDRYVGSGMSVNAGADIVEYMFLPPKAIPIFPPVFSAIASLVAKMHGMTTSFLWNWVGSEKFTKQCCRIMWCCNSGGKRSRCAFSLGILYTS